MLLIAAVAGIAAAFALAQYQVNRQVGQPIYGGGSSGGGSVRYGYVAPTAPRTAALMPSEVRNAAYRSGALPSEIHMNYASMGPLAPGGAAAYIPGGSPVVIRAGSAPQGNMVNPMQPRPMTAAPMAAAPMTGTIGSVPTSPSIHYGTSIGQAAWSAPMSNSVPTMTAVPMTATGINPGAPIGTIHYPNAK